MIHCYRIWLGRRWSLSWICQPSKRYSPRTCLRIPRVHIRFAEETLYARISFEETTPLHKQRNCGGVRASVDQGRRGRETEGGFYRHCDKTTLLAGEKATKEEISSFAFVLCIYYVRGCVCASQPRLPLSGSECARACACIAYTQRSTISSRGREYENTYAPCTARVRILLALREPGIFTTSGKWREEATFAPEPKCQRREKGFESFQRN